MFFRQISYFTIHSKTKQNLDHYLTIKKQNKDNNIEAFIKQNDGIVPEN